MSLLIRQSRCCKCAACCSIASFEQYSKATIGSAVDYELTITYLGPGDCDCPPGQISGAFSYSGTRGNPPFTTPVSGTFTYCWSPCVYCASLDKYVYNPIPITTETVGFNAGCTSPGGDECCQADFAATMEVSGNACGGADVAWDVVYEEWCEGAALYSWEGTLAFTTEGECETCQCREETGGGFAMMEGGAAPMFASAGEVKKKGCCFDA